MTIQEEKRRQRLKENKTERERWIASYYQIISHISAICPDVTPYHAACLLSKLSLRLPLLPYNSAQYSECKGFWNAWHSFYSASTMTFHNHCIDGFLMLARSMRVISNIHHPEATRSEQDCHDRPPILQDVFPTHSPTEILSHCNHAITMVVLS